MSTKAENLLNKFKASMNMAGQELISESSDSDLTLNSSENLDQIVSNNRETYLTLFQPKALKKRLEQLDPLSLVKKTDSKYKMPGADTLRLSHKKRFQQKKQQILDDISQTNVAMQGMLSVKETKLRATGLAQHSKKPV